MKKVLLNNFLFLFLFFNHLFCAQSILPPGDMQQIDKKVTVIIDPGHGGGDWGINYRGVYEKNITLDVAKRIRDKLIKNDPRMSVYLTRTDDQFLNINDRVNYANSLKGDIFLSIHCDFIPSENVSGYKIFYLFSNNVLDRGKNELINWDSVQIPYIALSKKLAGFIDQYMRAALIREDNSMAGNDEDDILPLDSRGVASIKSFLLKSINMPAVVIEIGNLNNKNDFSYLNNKNTIDRIAYHIKEGIINYLIKVNYQ